MDDDDKHDKGDRDAFDPLLAELARISPRELKGTWTPPAELDEYRLIRPLGHGGMGSVWLAQDTLLDRLVAVKFTAHATPSRRARERFAIEARAAARLSHSNVVTVYRYGEFAGRPYLVSEYIRGQSLDKIPRPVSSEYALELGIALARGLAATHRHGIVHRDIKPANAILAADGNVKLVDFGLARMHDFALEPAAVPAAQPTSDRTFPGSASACEPAVEVAGSSTVSNTGPSAHSAIEGEPLLRATPRLTRPGAIAGTPLYLAPEVRRGGVADRRSDVYQLGCILYELVTGRAPLFDVPGGSVAALDCDVPSLAPYVGSRFAAVVDRCLRRDPDARFASGEELREALEALAAQTPDGDLPEGNPYRGLLAFDAEHRALFFGRGPEIRAVIERLRSDPFVLVTGDSGVGKSSLCRAGVLPRIAEGALASGGAWTTAQIVPGRRPVAALVIELAARLGLDENELTRQVSDQPAQLPRELRRALGSGGSLLLFIDQLEEVITLAHRDEAMAFGRLLAHLVAGAPGVRVLATVRGDFVTRLAELPAVGDEIARALYVLRPITVEGAREAVIGPAHATGARFESEELVAALVAGVSDSGGGMAIELPLLAFTLSALWDARDPLTQTISAGSLEAIGGVRGALARHADGVLDALVPATRRTAARRVLLRLVTPERTRARRTAQELTDDLGALDALVRGRLLVARGDDPPTFELVHERLIDGWPTLAGWLSQSTAALAVHRRLATAVASWEQLERSKDALWRERQLADLALLADGDLSPSEAAFATASRRAARRRRALRVGLAIAVPVIIAAMYGSARLVATRDLAQRVGDNLVEADRVLRRARQSNVDSAGLQTEAFRWYDTGDVARGEASWTAARERDDDAVTAYAQAARSLEAALLLDPARGDLRQRMAALTFERIALAERDYRRDDRDELVARLALYDDGAFARRLAAPAELDVNVEPVGATVAIATDGGERPLTGPTRIAPGSYLLLASAPGHAAVRQPFVIHAGQQQRITITLPPAGAIPPGFAYIPAGRFLYGSRDSEILRRFYNATPMHERSTGAFLIGINEVTYAQWIDFLDDLPPAQRALHRPYVETSIFGGGKLELRRVGATWELEITPSSVGYRARAGTAIEYRDRTLRKRQDWLRLPVSGVSPLDSQDFAAWLDRTGRVPHARLCTEPEWEYAMRGADGRSFPHGERLDPDDANIDVTYGRREGGFGPDEVGSHPVSNSPFNIADGAGNIWEVVTSPTGFVSRGGSFFTGFQSAHLANREVSTPNQRHIITGVRICADPP